MCTPLQSYSWALVWDLNVYFQAKQTILEFLHCVLAMVVQSEVEEEQGRQGEAARRACIHLYRAMCGGVAGRPCKGPAEKIADIGRQITCFANIGF